MKKSIQISCIIALIGILIGCAATSQTGESKKVSKQSLTLESEHGIKFKADYYPSSKPDSPTVLILPGRSGVKKKNIKLAKALNKADFNVLSISYQSKWTREVAAKRGRTIDIVKNEVTASLDFLNSQANVDMDRIGILGSSMGTWVGFEAMAKFNNLKSLVMLSPIFAPSTLDDPYKGTQELAKAFGSRHLFLVASEKDRAVPKGLTAVEKADYLISIMPDAHIKKQYYSGDTHAHYMVEKHKELMGLIIQWFQETLSP